MISTFRISKAPLQEIETWIKNNAYGKHKENYQNIIFDKDYVGISTERINNNITCVSSVYARDYYPQGCVRIWNRWIATRKIGGKKSSILSDRALTMVNQQIALASVLGYESFFISYHSYIPKFCNKLTELLNDKSNFNWKHVGFVRVTPNNNKNSFQHFIYTGEEKRLEDLINTKIDYNTWRRLWD